MLCSKGGKTVNTLRIKTKIDTSDVPAQLNLLKQKLSDVENKISSTKRILSLTGKQADGLNMENFKKSLVKSEAEAEKLRSQINKIESSTEVLNSTNNKTFEKGINSIKKFGLSLLSIRGIYSMVSRASSAYLSQDTVLADKLQSVWVGLGSFLVPIIDMISNALLKGLGYLNVFIKALTGVDYVARANTKIMEKNAQAISKTAQAQKELNNQLYSFDEMNIQQSQISTGGVDVSTSGLQNLIEIPELDMSIVSKLQDLAHWLKENWDWLSKVAIALGTTFGVAKISGLLTNISNLIGGSGAGLLGLQAILVGLATVFTIKLYLEGYEKIKKSLDELNEKLQLVTQGEESLTNQTKTASDEFWKLYESGQATNETLKTQELHLKNSSTALVNQYQELENNIHWWGEFTDSNKKVRASQEELSKQMQIVTQDYERMYQQGLLNEQGVKNYITALDGQIRIMKTAGQSTSDLEQKFKNLTGQNWNATIKIDAQDNASNTINNLAGKLANLSGAFASTTTSVLKRMFGLKTGGIVKCATGSIVNNPGRGVMIGSNVIAGESGAEAVFPLTDPNAMSYLGETIGRYVTINLTNITKLDSRTINRQTNKANADEDFLGNW